ncbi:unnamed protein product [Paramecium sonneborni]|uniref:Uncharacterized protein n=1 Tax=Paramecium sonneborni TaxID=65129 RepID=A0A8S1RK66_9CILI|nr:unnamed protein product [Paramecium sonneborni]
MNKKQIKQEKVLKKKALYQEYWKSIFNKYRQANEKIKDGETNTNIQLNGDNIQNKHLLEQGFEKNLLQQKNIEKFSEVKFFLNQKHENTENKNIEQNILQKDQITSLQNKETLISQLNQNDLNNQSIKLIQKASNILSKSTRFQEISKGIEQTKQCSKVQLNLKKDINSYQQKNQVINNIQVNQVVSNIPSHNKQLTLQESFQKQHSNTVKSQSKKRILKKQQKSLKSFCKKLPTIELSKNEDNIKKDIEQAKTHLLKTQSSNINQVDQSNKQLLTTQNHDFFKDFSQSQEQEMNQNIQDDKLSKNCIETLAINQPKVIVHDYQENKIKEQQINNLITYNILQQSAAITDSENKIIVNKSGSQELQIQKDEQNQENKNKQPESYDKLNNSITASTQNVVRNQLIAVQKVIRNLNDRANIQNQLKFHQDNVQIQIDLDVVITEQSDLIPNYERFVECIQYLHNLEKAHVDKQNLAPQFL